MKFLVETYQTITGKFLHINLPNSTYGQWIIKEDNKPKYFIDCVGSNHQSDLKIKSLIDEGEISIDTIIDKISKYNNKKLSLDKKPFFSLKVESQIKKIKLKPVPLEWVKPDLFKNDK